MKTYPHPSGQGTIPAVILGLMRIADMEDRAIQTLVDKAIYLGITFFDHADIYGGSRHRSETRFGEAIRLSASQRDAVQIQSKVGIWLTGPEDGFRPKSFDFSTAHIVARVEASLQALRTDYLDVLLLHRPDALMEPHEVAAAFDRLAEQGKVRHFGVSNHTPGQIALLQTCVRQPLYFNQVQLSLTHASLISQGMVANMMAEPQSASRDLGLLDHARLTGMILQAWSPMQVGHRPGVLVGHPDFPVLNQRLATIAEAYGTTATAIACAWILRHPAGMQVVMGTTNPERLLDAANGAAVTLTRDEWYSLYLAAGNPLP